MMVTSFLRGFQLASAADGTGTGPFQLFHSSVANTSTAVTYKMVAGDAAAWNKIHTGIKSEGDTGLN